MSFSSTIAYDHGNEVSNFRTPERIGHDVRFSLGKIAPILSLMASEFLMKNIKNVLILRFFLETQSFLFKINNSYDKQDFE